MREIIMRNWDLGKLCMRVNLPSPISQVRVPIRRLIPMMQGLLNPIRQVIPLIYQVRSYPPYRPHLCPPSLSSSSTTLPSLEEHKVKSSISISPCHHHEITPSAAYTYDCLSSIHSLDFELTTECSFSFQRTSLQIDCHQPVLHRRFIGKVTLSRSHGFKLTNR